MGPVLRSENGSAQQEYLGPRGLINRTEYVRLLQQALHQLGYPELATRLEQESGITMQPRTATQFREAVLGGDFGAALQLLPQLSPGGGAAGERAAFLLLKQKYVEAVQRGDTAGALRCLRSELAPLQSAAPGGTGLGASRVLQGLAAMLLQPEVGGASAAGPSATDAEAAAAAQGGGGREALLAQLQALLPPSVLVPEARLEELVEQALLAQLDRCPYHNSRALRLSLFADYVAGPEQLPTATAQVLTGHGDEVWAVQFSADGRWMATASKDGSALLWKVGDTGEVSPSRAVLQGHSPVNIAVFSPDGRYLLVGAADGRMRVYDVPGGQLRCEVAVGGPADAATAAAWMPDSRQFVVAAPDRQLSVHDMELGGGVVRRMKMGGHVYDAVVSRDGGTVVAVQDRRLRYFRLADRRDAFAGPAPAAVQCLSASPDGRFVAANLASGVIQLWPLGDLRAPAGLAAVAARPGASDPLDALPAAPLQEYRGGGEEGRGGRYVIRSALGGAGCAFVASGSESGLVYLWHRESGEQLAALEGHSGTVNAVAWNPRNQYMLASAADDRTVRVWLAPAAGLGV